jgi:hypothetical protein
MKQLIDFFKIAGFKGIINYDFDFKDETIDLENLASAVSMINAKLVSNGYQRMSKFEYIRFMEFMKVHPAYHYNQYIVV